MTGYQVRRANIDDLPQLIELWRNTQLPVETLEKRLTEFQVVENAENKIIAAIGLHVQHHEGLLHGECFTDFGLSERLRPIMWERVERVARNHGLFRIWTQETAPFWRQAGFDHVPQEKLSQRPANFSGNEKLEWLAIQLKDASAAPLNIDREFEMYMQAERAKTEELRSRAKVLYGFGLLLAILLAAFCVTMLFRSIFLSRRRHAGEHQVIRLTLETQRSHTRSSTACTEYSRRRLI